jgi:hypothetical protein
VTLLQVASFVSNGHFQFGSFETLQPGHTLPNIRQMLDLFAEHSASLRTSLQHVSSLPNLKQHEP